MTTDHVLLLGKYVATWGSPHVGARVKTMQCRRRGRKKEIWREREERDEHEVEEEEEPCNPGRCQAFLS